MLDWLFYYFLSKWGWGKRNTSFTKSDTFRNTLMNTIKGDKSAIDKLKEK